jgi:signal peptidase I
MNDRAARTPPDYPENASSAATEPQSARSSSETNIKETIEQILVAFILAFIFRAFVVEAFVIPTGSMAPTLLGAHMRFRCEDCGWQWTVNFPTPDREDISIPRNAGPMPVASRQGGPADHMEDYVFSARCPNCGYKVQRRDREDPDNSATNPPVSYGDRILVLKYLYLFQEPRRWDVVVFKAPADPQTYDYGQNYIKRLVGKPGETLMILDGDIYTSTANKPLADLTPDDFEIQRKGPRIVQEALWRIVYDDDHHPHNSAARADQNDPMMSSDHDEKWMQPWKSIAGNGWDLGTDATSGKVFRFDNADGSSTIQFDDKANPQKQSLTDWLAYDVTVNQMPRGSLDKFNAPIYTADNNVGDIKLAFFYQRNDGSGPLRLSATKIDQTFVAQVEPGKVSLFRKIGNGAESLIRSVPVRNDFARPTRVELTNVDYRITVRIDDRDVIVTKPEEYSPNVRALLDAFERNQKMDKPVIQISADHQSCAISHLSLWRDIYYMNRSPAFSGGSQLEWATPFRFPSKLVRLKKDEFFVCGDNSPISGDARYWSEPINLPNEELFAESGRVPRRFLLGKAFFVYWPAGFRPIDPAPAVVPNFGDMRFIH